MRPSKSLATSCLLYRVGRSALQEDSPSIAIVRSSLRALGECRPMPNEREAPSTAVAALRIKVSPPGWCCAYAVTSYTLNVGGPCAEPNSAKHHPGGSGFSHRESSRRSTRPERCCARDCHDDANSKYQRRADVPAG
eukprot:2270646-Prymnesium_polylepis.1